jgi:MFS transporter, PAT family, beta-lactamase induction signal transducer AmpG
MNKSLEAPRRPRPYIFLVLMLPHGISYGYSTILLPFLMTRAGLPVALAASATAIAILPNVLAAIWGPIVDLSLTIRRWYGIGVLTSTVAFIVLSIVPVRRETVWILTTGATISQVGVNLVSVSMGAAIARTISNAEKGCAGGYFQAGILCGAALSGGAGVWLVSHASEPIALLLLASIAPTCTLALRFVPALPPFGKQLLKQRFREFGTELWGLIRSPEGRLVTLLVMSPIGIGAATNLWAGIGPEWQATPNVVAFATGVVNGLAAAIGCVGGGWIADRAGPWIAFFGSGLMMAGVAILMADGPRAPAVFGSGVLFYAASQGWANAAFSALVLRVIGRTAAATKYAILSSLGNIPLSYMTAFDGFMHDHSGTANMLYTEAFLGFISVAVGVVAIWRTLRCKPAAVRL